MLSWTTVMKYVTGRLALPSTFIEKSEKEMKEWCIMTSLKTFSDFFPDVEWTTVLSGDPKYRVLGKAAHYYFFDEERLDILGIINCYMPLGHDMLSGHPPMGAFSFEGAKWWALEVFKSRFFKPFSMWDYTYRFIPPNQVRVLPDPNGNMSPGSVSGSNFVVEYERMQPSDLRKIPAAMARQFMELCYADVAIWISSIRQNYGDGQVETPFGSINLRGNDLKQEALDIKRELEEQFRDETIPGISIDVG